LGYDWVGFSWVYLGLVDLVCGMQQEEACGHNPGFGYRGETC
jgi:hypothetical protein